MSHWIPELAEIGIYIKTLFYVSVSFHHSFAFETNSTKTIHSVIQEAYLAEKTRLKVMFVVLNGMKIFLGAYIIFLLVRYVIFFNWSRYFSKSPFLRRHPQLTLFLLNYLKKKHKYLENNGFCDENKNCHIIQWSINK